MTWQVRLAEDHELPLAYQVSSVALLFALDEAGLELRRPLWPYGRSHVALDGDELVGHVRYLRFQTTVPGGARVPTGGVTMVGVLPTHRRRGLLTALMAAQLDDLAAEGMVLASLRAAEWPIYGRFGYGMAGSVADLRIRRDRAAFRPGVRLAAGRVRMLGRDEALDVLPALYDRVGRSRVGAIDRPLPWWPRLVESVIAPATNAWAAVHEDPDGVADGYVTWSAPRGAEPDERGDTEVVVDEHVAADPGVAAALWRFVLDLDLATVFTLPRRPLDEPLRFLLADGRALATEAVVDEQWVRLVDVGAALGARTYGSWRRGVVISVRDARLPVNDGCWLVDHDGASRTDGPPDLVCDVAALGAAYLGGTSWRTLVEAGLVESPGGRDALDAADGLFAVRPLPFCGSFF